MDHNIRLHLPKHLEQLLDGHDVSLIVICAGVAVVHRAQVEDGNFSVFVGWVAVGERRDGEAGVWLAIGFADPAWDHSILCAVTVAAGVGLGRKIEELIDNVTAQEAAAACYEDGAQLKSIQGGHGWLSSFLSFLLIQSWKIQGTRRPAGGEMAGATPELNYVRYVQCYR